MRVCKDLKTSLDLLGLKPYKIHDGHSPGWPLLFMPSSSVASARKELTPLQGSGMVFCLFPERPSSCKLMVKIMYLTAVYSYFYFYAFDSGGSM
jgi:hypothetical protein